MNYEKDETPVQPLSSFLKDNESFKNKKIDLVLLRKDGKDCCSIMIDKKPHRVLHKSTYTPHFFWPEFIGIDTKNKYIALPNPNINSIDDTLKYGGWTVYAHYQDPIQTTGGFYGHGIIFDCIEFTTHGSTPSIEHFIGTNGRGDINKKFEISWLESPFPELFQFPKYPIGNS